MRCVCLAALFLLSACWGKGETTVEVVEETWLPYRQPGSDPKHPAMFILRDNGDGTTQRLQPSATTTPSPSTIVWGKQYRVRVERTRNPTWSTSTRRVVAVVHEVDALNETFIVRGLSAPYLGVERRSFIDGKRFQCQSATVCDDIDAATQGTQPFDLRMRFGTTAEAPLVALAVVSSSTTTP